MSTKKETIPKSVMYQEEQQSQKKEFHLKDPFRDPFREASELHYVDVDVDVEEAEKQRTCGPPPAKPTIYHQLLHGSSTPLSTRPAVGVVIPSHSSQSFPSVISYQLKPKTQVRDQSPDIPPPLPLRSVTMLPAPKITPRG